MAQRRIQKTRLKWSRKPTEQVFEDSRRKRARDQEIQDLKDEIQDALEDIDRELNG